ncbi:CRISPR-associated helicase Cas3' [Saccharothrix obliqua]|uniref:CRISPR-associated helicase Cas3' n=1 Tax=Saccharothrix obliqua TaxID=2861747 RepID=UPI001C5DCF73|nr:CRISPR-associated helicase Cas3' [Saccharothrix obliqua]MBW4717328.1 CRISPR-associated helicase Cas3' [Saccharothrix obliqua]
MRIDAPWAKDKDLDPRYPLVHHLLDAAAAGRALWELHATPGMRRWLTEELGMSEDETGSFVALLAGLHDIGKAMPCFQEQKLRPGAHGYLHHAEAAYLILPTLLDSEVAKEAKPDLVACRIGQLLAGHHGVFPSPKAWQVERPLEDDRLGGEEWHRVRVELVAAIRGVLGGPRLPESLSVEAATVLTGLVVVADWVVSDVKDFIPHQQANAPEDLEERYRYTLEVVRRRVVEVGLRAPTFVESLTTEQVWGFAPNALQRSLQEEWLPGLSESGLLIVSTSTGSGKSEAALLAAHGLGRVTGRSGVYFGLPTMATADAMRARVAEFVAGCTVGGVPVTLAHSMARFSERYEQDADVTAWLRDPNTTLLAGLCVGTIDQALLAGLRVRHNALRVHALANKTLIIDEVHSYDAYMLELLASLLNWCGRLGTPVVLLSATLPKRISDRLVSAYLGGAGIDRSGGPEAAYPGWVFVGRSGSVLSPSVESAAAMAVEKSPVPVVEVRRHARSAESRFGVITEYAGLVRAGGGSLAVLCNTVASAQQTFARLRAWLADAEVDLVLLHSRFPLYQRQEITEELQGRLGKGGRRDRPVIVVATQVIEQSLDLDFDLMVSDLAPIALLIQRLGRCWRHDLLVDGRPARPSWCVVPRLVVLDPVDLESSEPCPPEWGEVYPEFELAATHLVLAGRRPELRVPHDVDALVQEVHSTTMQGVPAALREAWLTQYAKERTQVQFAAVAGVGAVSGLVDLAQLSKNEVSELDVSTRLGIDTARLIPRYTGPDGKWFLDSACSVEWPTGRPGVTEVKLLIRHSVTCPDAWVRDAVAAGRLAPDPRWKRSSVLRDALVLPAPAHGDLRLDRDLGLFREGKK